MAYHSNALVSLRSMSEKTTLFDQQIYHIVGVNRYPLNGELSITPESDLINGLLKVTTSNAVKWDDFVKHFTNYYVIVSACNRQDDCFVVAHQKTKTAAIGESHGMCKHCRLLYYEAMH